MDRVFQKSEIENLVGDLEEIIKECKGHVKDLKAIAREVKAVAMEIPSELPDDDLVTAANQLMVEAEDIDFTLLTKKLSESKGRIDRIISEDKNCGSDTDAVKTQINSIKQVLEEMEGFMGNLSATVNYKGFTTLLETASNRWNKNIKDVSQTLEQIEANLKGAEDISVSFSADPINLSTGNFIYDRTDLQTGGKEPFLFRRFYNARNKRSGSLGADWNHNYEVTLEEAGAEKVLILEEGKEERFLKTTTGSYASLYHSNGSLEETSEGYLYKTKNQTRYYFDKEGRYLSQETLAGSRITLYYEESKAESGETRKRLLRVERETGEAYTLTYTAKGYLDQVSDHSGRSIMYQVRGNKLIGVKTPKGHWYRYGYGSNGKLESVENPRGITTVENEYDAQQRTIRQTFPDGVSMTCEYDDEKRSVLLTERNGSKVTYVHDEQYRDIKHIYRDGEERFEYNKLNQKTLVVDKAGNKTQYGYDEKGNLTRVINALGSKTELQYEANDQLTYLAIDGEIKVQNKYDEYGNLSETKDAMGNCYTIHYEKQGQPFVIEQPDGSQISLTYDECGNVIKLTDAMGGISRYQYDALNRISQTIDGNGNETTYAYDDEDNLVKVTDANGNTRSYEYNKSNKITRIIDFDGSELKREYNVLNRPSKVIDQLGRETHLSYDAMWNLARVTEPNGARTTYLYNEDNQLGRIRNVNGDLIRYEYDNNGNRTKVIDEEGNETTFTYDVLGQLIQVKGEEGLYYAYTYTKEGQISEIEDALGNRVYASYDANGKLIKETGPTGEERSYGYTALGKIASVTDEAGRTTNYHYESGGRLREIIHADQTRENYTYDRNGNIKTFTSRLRVTQTYHYDGLNRVTKIEGMQGESKSYSYDAVGNVIAMTDVLGNKTEYQYTLTGQLAKVIDAMGNETEYDYDERDQLIGIRQYELGEFKTKREEGKEDIPGIEGSYHEVTKSNQAEKELHITRYQRNLSGQITMITDAHAKQESYRYDRIGQLIEKIDKEGYVTTYAYTGLGDIKGIQYADGRAVTFSYDSLRQLKEIEDWLGCTKIKQDALGRTIKVIDPKEREVTYTWGSGNERKSVGYPDGKQAIYHYDEHLRLIEVKDEAIQVNYTYDELSRLKEKVYTDGVKSNYTYTSLGQLESLSHYQQGELVDHYQYKYDIQGNKTQIEKQRRGLPEESGRYEYQYDSLNRLKEVQKDGSLLRRYGYDGYGNRSSLENHGKESSYRYNALNQLIFRVDSEHEEQYHYDKRGNLTEVQKDGEVTNQYWYGSLNRLEKAMNHTKGQGAEYQYNGLGHRIGRIEGEIKREVEGISNVPGSLKPTRQIEDVLDLTKGYHNLLQRAENQAITTYTWDSNVVSMAGANGSSYYLQDELGSPLRLLREDGMEQERYGYDEFGQETYFRQEQRTGRSNDRMQPFTYTGYQKDEIANTYYAQMREYQPVAGRFMGEDIIKGNGVYPFTLNPYVYCWNAPLGWVDLDGRKPTEVEAAYMAQNIYKTTKDDYGKTVGGGWILENIITGGDGVKIGVYSKVDRFGRKEYALVNKGSTITSTSDWKNNVQQPFGESKDMKVSIEKARGFVDSHLGSEVTMVGHSKGGAEAAANAVATGANCIVFNPATVFLEGYRLHESDYRADMNVYIIKGEILNFILGKISRPIDEVEYLEGTQGMFLNHSMEAMIEALEKKYGSINSNNKECA